LSVYWISGGSGSLGTALTLHLLKAGHKVRTFSRNQHNIEILQGKVPKEQLGNLSCHEGYVEDLERVKLSMEGVDYAVHAAAAKIIPACEYNPIQCINANITGSANVVMGAKHNHIKKAVLVSTDKASSPATLYGGTKFVAERLWLNANRYSAGKEPHFVAVRYGNVFASQGSVIHAFVKQAQYGHLELTDPQCTRFHLKLDQAVAFVLQALHSAGPGELWVPKLPSYRLGDLAHAFRIAYGLSKQPTITGLRLSEKLHESMISTDESASMRAEEDLHYTLEPGVIHRKGGFSYNSGANEWKLGVEALTEEIREWSK
jgi:UDP-N-acetylglucosamine 4,6-dehydratase